MSRSNYHNGLSLFQSSPLKLPKYPPPSSSFEPRLVGLGIVAALNSTTTTTTANNNSNNDNNTNSNNNNNNTSIIDNNNNNNTSIIDDTRFAKSPVSPKSDPIPIGGGKSDQNRRRPESDTELSESYTCVISHLSGEPSRVTEYFDGELHQEDGMSDNIWDCSGLFWVSTPPARVVGYLTETCCLCGKLLNGLDIFMYRGEKAFCSVECRYKHMLSDEHMEKCGSEALKPFPCSDSPCSAPGLFSSGVAAA